MGNTTGINDGGIIDGGGGGYRVIYESILNKYIVMPNNTINGGIYFAIDVDIIGIQDSIYNTLYPLANLLDNFNHNLYYCNDYNIKHSRLSTDYYPRYYLSSLFEVITFDKCNFNNIKYINFFVDYSVILPNARLPYLNIYKKNIHILPIDPKDVISTILTTYFKYNNEENQKIVFVNSNKLFDKSIINFQNFHRGQQYSYGNRDKNWWNKLKYLYNADDLLEEDDYWSYYILSKILE